MLLFAATVAYAVHIGAERPIERFNRFAPDFDVRSRYARKTVALFEDYPLSGVGIGNFQYAYPRYQSLEDSRLFFRYAHNDWAQFMAEAGIVGLMLLVGGGAFWTYRTFRLWRHRPHPFAVGLGVAPFAAMIAMAVHEYSDFNLHIPANFLMFMALLAIGHSALHLQFRGNGDWLALREFVLPIRSKRMFAGALLVGVIFWNGFWTLRHFVAECYCNTVTNSTFNRDQSPSPDEIQQAAVWDPGNAAYGYRLALAQKRTKEAEQNPHGPVENVLKQKNIVRAMETAARRNPLQKTYHLQLGWEYVQMWMAAPENRQKWLDAADTAMTRAAYFSGQAFPDDHMELGSFWLMRSKTVAYNSTQWWTAWNKARWHFRQSISGEKDTARPGRIEKIKSEIKAHYSDPVFEERILGADG